MNINEGARIGIIIEIIAIVIMLFLFLFNKPIPSVVMWIFVTGAVVALVGTLLALSKKELQIIKGIKSIKKC